MEGLKLRKRKRLSPNKGSRRAVGEERTWFEVHSPPFAAVRHKSYPLELLQGYIEVHKSEKISRCNAFTVSRSKYVKRSYASVVDSEVACYLEDHGLDPRSGRSKLCDLKKNTAPGFTQPQMGTRKIWETKGGLACNRPLNPLVCRMVMKKCEHYRYIPYAPEKVFQGLKK